MSQLKVKAADLPSFEGKDLGTSSWMEITQDRINQFADATNDHQFIHVDPEKGALTPFGGTIAHGFLTLSLVPSLIAESSIEVEDVAMALNYGSDAVRFLQPVPAGSRIRAHQKLVSATEKRAGQWLLKTRITVEIEDQEKPALIAEFLVMYFIK